MNYRDFFRQATGHEPFDYQLQLAEASPWPILICVPTGLGKMAAVVLAWLWQRIYGSEKIRSQTPRRLVYCLPTRTLVEQAYQEAHLWLNRLGLSNTVNLHLLMGGAVAQDWDWEPEKSTIVVGTQDQLVSRALNRGYAMSRYRWPIQYAQLNNDCLWVMDETQLMGIAASTTAQLQGFRDKFGTYGPTHSVWMSATLDPAFLDTPDFKQDYQNSTHSLTLTAADHQSPVVQQRLGAVKHLSKLSTTLSEQVDVKGKPLPAAKQETVYAESLANEIYSMHEQGTLTLVICNRVSRAQAVYRALRKIAQEKQSSESITLVHSRFRSHERQKQMGTIQAIRRGETTGILVTTQAVEAGVDISAKTLITELAPWPSLVQRFGRCNRKGEFDEATVGWVDIPDPNWKGIAKPYTPEELNTARQHLEPLSDVGLRHISTVAIQTPESEGLIPRETDIVQLFDTSVDLAGHDVDIAPFIRDADDLDVLVAWRDWEGTEPPDDPTQSDYRGALQREELCPVRVYQIREFLQKVKGKAWVWDGKWTQTQSFYPGQRLLLRCSVGGYSKELGFTGNPKDQPQPVTLAKVIEPDNDERDILSRSQWETLPDHSAKTDTEAATLCQAIQTGWGSAQQLPAQLLQRAARWHDAGKAHEVFQTMLCWEQTTPPPQPNQIWAKAPQVNERYKWPSDRRGFRHELASALMALQMHEDFLLVYLVACHHGKVRMNIQPRPNENKPRGKELFALGVHEGDAIPPVDLGGNVNIPALQLSLQCMRIGPDSWTDRAFALLQEYGPFRLAFLEMVVRLADWRASTSVNTME